MGLSNVYTEFLTNCTFVIVVAIVIFSSCPCLLLSVCLPLSACNDLLASLCAHAHNVSTRLSRQIRTKLGGGARKARILLLELDLTSMSVLEGLEDFVRDKVEKERWTHKQISAFLEGIHPGQRGFSVRSVERFCSYKGIHKTPPT